jgi:hypothetical protein
MGWQRLDDGQLYYPPFHGRSVYRQARQGRQAKVIHFNLMSVKAEKAGRAFEFSF